MNKFLYTYQIMQMCPPVDSAYIKHVESCVNFTWFQNINLRLKMLSMCVA